MRTTCSCDKREVNASVTSAVPFELESAAAEKKVSEGFAQATLKAALPLLATHAASLTRTFGL